MTVSLVPEPSLPADGLTGDTSYLESIPFRTGTPFPWQGAQWQELTSFWNSSRAFFMFCFTVLEKAKSVPVTSSYRGSAWEVTAGIDFSRKH